MLLSFNARINQKLCKVRRTQCTLWHSCKLPDFFVLFCFVKIYNICSKLYKAWVFKSIFFCIRMQRWMIGMLIKSQSFILYKHFLFFYPVSNFISPFWKIPGQKNEIFFCRDQPVSLSLIFKCKVFQQIIFYLGLV